MTKAVPPTDLDPDARRSRRGPLRKVLMSLLALVAMTGLVAVGYVVLLAKAADDNLTQAPLLPTTQTSGSEAQAVPERNPDLPPENRQSPPSSEWAQHGALNMLVIGEDQSDGVASRADVIILVHVSQDRQRLDLVHFPRDYYVSIPGYGHNKINASYAWGGAPLLVETVQEVSGVKIDHAAITDFEGFEETVDALGGVEVAVRESSPARGVSPAYTEGTTVHMDGRLALDFARQRKHLSQGDLGRGQRQMDLLAAIVDRVMTPSTLANPSEMAGVVSSVAGNVITDEGLGTNQIARLAFDLREVRGGDIHTWSAPWAGMPTRDGMSVVEPDWDRLEVLREALVNDSMDKYQEEAPAVQG